MNSGNAKAPLAKYLKSNKVPWPAIADTSRQFEKACGFKDEISLQNIHQVRFITSQGQLKYGRFDDLPGVAKQALQGAKWKVDPSTVPESLKSAWRAIEFGDYKAAAKEIAKGVKSSDSETQTTAKKFREDVLKEFKQQVNPAVALAREGEFWPAYKEIARIDETFGEFGLPKRFFTMKDKLEEKKEVAGELRAMNQLKRARELASSRVKSKASIGRKRLQAIIEDHPDTEAAAIVREALGLPPKEKFR